MKFLFLIFSICAFSLYGQDWANMNRFKSKNEKDKLIPKKGKVVFMGNSITEGWLNADSVFWEDPKYVNRGIGGQTTPQMLVRFRQDVIDLNPEVVVILAGVNDIAGNTGAMTLEETFGNIKSMAQLALTNEIKVLICSVLPAYDFHWSPGKNPAQKIIELNKMLAAYSEEQGFIFVNYHEIMADDRQGLPPKYSYDEVHCTPEGYTVMKAVLIKSLDKALR